MLEATRDFTIPVDYPPNRLFVTLDLRCFGMGSHLLCGRPPRPTTDAGPHPAAFLVAIYGSGLQRVCRCRLHHLCPLPIPGHLWSHILVDIVTGLAPSEYPPSYHS